MRFNYSSSSSFFFLPFGKNPHQKIFFSPLFGLSRPTKNLRFCVFSRKHLSLSSPPALYIQIFCFLPFFKRTVFDEKMKKSQKSQKCKVKSRDTLSLNFPKVAILTHEYSSTLLHKQQCLLLLNKSRPSPASRPPRFKYVSLSFVFPFRDPIRSDRARARLRLPGITFLRIQHFIRYGKIKCKTIRSLSL